MSEPSLASSMTLVAGNFKGISREIEVGNQKYRTTSHAWTNGQVWVVLGSKTEKLGFLLIIGLNFRSEPHYLLVGTASTTIGDDPAIGNPIQAGFAIFFSRILSTPRRSQLRKMADARPELIHAEP